MDTEEAYPKQSKQMESYLKSIDHLNSKLDKQANRDICLRHCLLQDIKRYTWRLAF